ncbi:MAG: PEGA domain-containing protein [Prevotella sp.]|nr:PEGA domain-containing protein [Prevotella sp.]
MITRKLYILLLSFLLPLLLQAQELTVKSMEMAPMDLSASTHSRNDKNGTPCALVKVRLAAVGTQFEGNVLGSTEYKAGEYWVYMSQGSYMLKVKHSYFLPLDVNFRDYDIRGVQPKTTYVLTLLMPQAGSGNVDDGMRYLALTVEPKDATVMIDDIQQTVGNGGVKTRLTKGLHRYSVMAAGYATQQGEVTLSEGTERLQVRLKSVMASVTIRCTTVDADVYVNNEFFGKAPWQGTLKAGNYEVEARLPGYRSNRQIINLTESERRTIEIPALQAITGNLDVNYDPMGAEVWMDGKKLGQSPEIFRNILVGRHEVELHKSGYQPKEETVDIQEGQTLVLGGKLEVSAAGQTSSASGTDNGHEWVDLGLSVCWATTNVGASKPGDYGDYYAWGETSTKSEYNWSTYKYGDSEKSLSKYCTKSSYGTVDNKTVLESSDDVAQVKWGGSWRMPSIKELQELKKKCKWEWTQQDGHDGYRVTGPNGNSIFLPTAGYRYYSLHNLYGMYAYYWSRTFFGGSPGSARYLGFSAGGVYTGYDNRYYGRSVRPVRVSE